MLINLILNGNGRNNDGKGIFWGVSKCSKWRFADQQDLFDWTHEQWVRFAQSCPVEALSNPKNGGLGRPGRLLNSGWY